jgi:hypothetical protein
MYIVLASYYGNARTAEREHERSVPYRTQYAQLYAQLFAQLAAEPCAYRNTHEAPRFGAVILHQQFVLFEAVELTLVASLLLLLHVAMPDTVCFTVPLPWVDVTDHVPGAPSV